MSERLREKMMRRDEGNRAEPLIERRDWSLPVGGAILLPLAGIFVLRLIQVQAQIPLRTFGPLYSLGLAVHAFSIALLGYLVLAHQARVRWLVRISPIVGYSGGWYIFYGLILLSIPIVMAIAPALLPDWLTVVAGLLICGVILFVLILLRQSMSRNRN